MGRSGPGYLLLDAGCPGWHSIRSSPSLWQLFARLFNNNIYKIYMIMRKWRDNNCVGIAIVVG